MKPVINRLLVPAIASLLLFANCLNAAQNSNGWKKFTSTENGFSAQLPKAPDHMEQKIDIPQSELSISYDTYISEPSESVVFVISVWNYPAEVDMSKPEVNLQDGFGGMLSALPGSQVQSMEMTEVEGFKALEFKVKNEDIYFQGKLILVYNTLYQVFAVYKDDKEMSADYQKFIDSFQLINPGKNKVAPPTKNGTTPKKMKV